MCFGVPLVDILCCKGQGIWELWVPLLMLYIAARWPRLFISTRIMIVPQGTSEDQRAAAVGNMPI